MKRCEMNDANQYWSTKACEVATKMQDCGVRKFTVEKSGRGYTYNIVLVPVKRQRQECPVCKKSFSVTKSGHIHSHHDASGQWCDYFK